MTRTSTLPRSTPEAEGVPSAAIDDFVRAAEHRLDSLHSLMLVRHGKVVAEGWWEPYGAQHPHLLFSVSKSFTSIAVGLAIADGLLSLDDTVVALLPDDLPLVVSDTLALMRVRDLLTMTTGHAVDSVDLADLNESSDWAKVILAQPVEFEPGTQFTYNSGATYLLAAILHRLTGVRLLDYLTPRLLAPLGIVGATWQQSPQGIDIGGWGLSLTTEDIATFGQLLLQRGEWNGTRLVPSEWVDTATSLQVGNDGRNENPDWEQGYGFQFWRCRHNAYRADGAFGQFVIVFPDHDAVLAITSGVENSQPILDLVWQHLLPALGSTALPESGSWALGTLALQTPAGSALTGSTAPDVAVKVAGIRYGLPANAAGLTAVALSEGTLSLWIADSRHDLPLGHGTWAQGITAPLGAEVTAFAGATVRVATAAAWTSESAFEARLSYYETPYMATIVLDFAENSVTVDVRQHVSFATTHLMHVVGRPTS